MCSNIKYQICKKYAQICKLDMCNTCIISLNMLKYANKNIAYLKKKKHAQF